MIQRIDKIIASQGEYSRSEIKKLIRSGAVKIDGRVLTSADEKVDADNCEITVCGKSLNYKQYIYIMLNKPQGVVSATNDTKQKTVIDLVPPQFKRQNLFPAGRLDADTTGFVLITDDGDFAHKLLAPRSHVDKIYHAVLFYPLDEHTVRAFKNGALLKDGTECMSAAVSALSEDGKTVEVILHEGKYHQVKRMFASCSNHVEQLRRVNIGGVELDASLGEGDCRELTDREREQLFAACGYKK